MKIHCRADLEDARERGEILDGHTTPEQLERISGQFYYFDCMDGDLSECYFAAGLFDDLREARRIAYDHEAVLTEHTFTKGKETGKSIEHTRYIDQGEAPYNGDVFAEDIQRHIDANKTREA